MNTHKPLWSWVVIGATLAFVMQSPLATLAQEAQPVAAQGTPTPIEQDPPGRVARLDYMDGAVSFQPGGENDWVDAVLNRPLTTGDNLWADEESRAEVHIGSTALRLGPKTGITLLEVSDHASQIRLAMGSLIVKVRHVDDEDAYEIDTPNIAFTIDQPGDYRLDVDPDGTRTEIVVWRGRGEVTGGGSSYTVVANQYATFTGTDQLNYDLGQLPDSDGFDKWALARDQSEDESDSANYVSREMTGYEDLDEYGDWTYVAGYGTCWQPRALVVGWAPYRFGHWIWVGPWGWTWVGDEPWGFAPFHYGRWASAANGWFWVPGPSVVRPIYAPALVAWVGGAPGFNFAFGAGVGWFPLAPGEVFIPGYRVSRAYVNNVNLTNTRVDMTRITTTYNTVVINHNVAANNIAYANRGVNGATTVVARDTFVNARPVARNVVSVQAKELAAAPVSHMAAVEPTGSSVLGAGTRTANTPPAVMTSRPVVALRTPAPMPRSFGQRQAEAGGHLNQEPVSQSLVRQQPPGRPATTGPAMQPSQSPDGFRSFGSANAAGNQPKAQPRVWEEQGTPEPEPTSETHPGHAPQPAANAPAYRRDEQQPQWSHPLAKPVTPVRRDEQQHQQKDQEQKFSNWHQQKPASPAPQRQQSAPSHTESAPKK
jgi:hypothetical protein